LWKSEVREAFSTPFPPRINVAGVVLPLRVHAVSIGLSTTATRQAEAPSDILTLRSTVRRVLVDRDSNNKPVHGLTANDFVVAEDGQPQSILSCDIHDFDTPSISLPANAPHMAPNNFVNIPPAPERGPLYVILYDLANIEIDDQLDARRQVMKFIKNMPPRPFLRDLSGQELRVFPGRRLL
jgi:hypothetical protein